MIVACAEGVNNKRIFIAINADTALMSQ